jgi:hypothetical protein
MPWPRELPVSSLQVGLRGRIKLGAQGEAGNGQGTPPQGEARRGLETLPREDVRVHEPPPETLPQKAERKPEALRLPRKREHEWARTRGKREGRLEMPPQMVEREPSWLPRELSREDTPSTWEGPGSWDPGSRLGKEISI